MVSTFVLRAAIGSGTPTNVAPKTTTAAQENAGGDGGVDHGRVNGNNASNRPSSQDSFSTLGSDPLLRRSSCAVQLKSKRTLPSYVTSLRRSGAHAILSFSDFLDAFVGARAMLPFIIFSFIV